jgi:hypothetical protein
MNINTKELKILIIILCMTEIEKYLGMHHNEQIKKGENIEDNWNDKYKFEVIGSQYCGSRHFKVDNETFEVFKSISNYARESRINPRTIF